MITGFQNGTMNQSLDDSASLSSSSTSSVYEEAGIFFPAAIKGIVDSLYQMSVPIEDVIDVIINRRSRITATEYSYSQVNPFSNVIRERFPEAEADVVNICAKGLWQAYTTPDANSNQMLSLELSHGISTATPSSSQHSTMFSHDRGSQATSITAPSDVSAISFQASTSGRNSVLPPIPHSKTADGSILCPICDKSLPHMDMSQWR